MLDEARRARRSVLYRSDPQPGGLVVTQPLSIVFALFPGITQLDFTGPFEILRHLPGASVVVASREGGNLTADSGLVFAGLTRLEDVTAADVICVVGGQG